MSQQVTSAPHPAAALLAEAGWSPFLDRVLMGLCHDVNGRVASLGAVLQLVELGEPIPPSFGGELGRLEDVAKRMSLLVGHVEAPPVPLDVPTLLGRAVELQEHVKEPRGSSFRLDVAPGLPPVLVNEGRCFRTLALFVDLAAGSGAASIALGGDADGVEVGFEVEVERLDDSAMVALDRLAALDGGGVTLAGTRCSLRLPSLSRARSEGH